MADGPLGSVLDPRPPARLGGAEEASDRELLERFTRGRDEEAFATLVRRHGPVVMGICRRVLRNWDDAQDACQVTFLVFASKAATLKEPELLANWLHGVAYRTAAKARDQSMRRRACERQAAGAVPTAPERPAEAREVLAVLTEELNRLPEKHRVPLVRCYLQGQTHRQAAHELGHPLGSMSWRLTRAREMLRKRLSGRGLLS